MPNFFHFSFLMAAPEGPALNSIYYASKGIVSIIDHKSIHVSPDSKDDIHFNRSIKHNMTLSLDIIDLLIKSNEIVQAGRAELPWHKCCLEEKIGWRAPRDSLQSNFGILRSLQ